MPLSTVATACRRGALPYLSINVRQRSVSRQRRQQLRSRRLRVPHSAWRHAARSRHVHVTQRLCQRCRIRRCRVILWRQRRWTATSRLVADTLQLSKDDILVLLALLLRCGNARALHYRYRAPRSRGLRYASTVGYKQLFDGVRGAHLERRAPCGIAGCYRGATHE